MAEPGRPLLDTELCDIIDMTKRRVQFDKECYLHDRLAQCAVELCNDLSLPPVKHVAVEKPLFCSSRARKANIRCDVLVNHTNGDKTIIEAKRVKGFADATSAIAQLLMYEQSLIDGGHTGRINFIAAFDGPLFAMHFRMVERLGLNVRFLHCQDTHYSIVDLVEYAEAV